MFYVVFFLALLFEFVNGFTDAPNSIATVVSTRVLRPMAAVVMAAFLNLLGALLTGTAVAKVISKDIIDFDAVTLQTLAATLLGASIWSMAAQRFGIPTSESHGLVAGLIGAGVAAGGWDVVVGSGTQKTLIGLVTSPMLGFIIGLILMTTIYWAFRRVRLAVVRGIFGRAQIFSAGIMAFSHGSNDGQKTMGVLALTLFLAGRQPGREEPFIELWIILLAATVMGLGTAFGGWRVVRTLGVRMTKLEPVQGFAAETRGIALRGAGQHHPRHRFVDHGGRRDQAILRRSMGRGRKHRDCVGPDVARLRLDLLWLEQTLQRARVSGQIA